MRTIGGRSATLRDTTDYLTECMGRKVWVELRDGTTIDGRVDAISAAHLHMGWLAIPLAHVRGACARIIR